MSDSSIFIRGIMVHGRHGTLEHEARVGQRFLVDIELHLDLLSAAKTDNLSDTVCYAQVVRVVISAFSAQNYRLLERTAGEIGHSILTAFPKITEVKVTVHKPHASVAAIFHDIGVVINCDRHSAISTTLSQKPDI
jgi:dihydroneopterin aldolase